MNSFRLTHQDWISVFWIAASLAAMAWLMAGLGVVYAPVPMFAAAVAAGLLFRGRPQQASLAAALAGIAGGILAERAYHVVRMQKQLMGWVDLTGWERFGLSAAELFLYTSLLSFFAAFISWCVYKERREEPRPRPTAAKSDPMNVEIPLFKPDPQELPKKTEK